MNEEQIKKLRMRSGQRLLILNAPEEYKEMVEKLPEGVELAKGSEVQENGCDLVLLFVKSVADLEMWAEQALKAIKYNGLFWIAYPKKSSKMKTDISRDVGWNRIHQAGYEGVALISFDDTWSVMRFRPKELTSSSSERRATAMKERAKKGTAAQQGDRSIVIPEDLMEVLHEKNKAKEFFDSLSYSHKKEYVNWITEAKREETRKRRIAKTVEMLESGLKNPSKGR